MAERIDPALLSQLRGCSVDEDPQQMRLITGQDDSGPSLSPLLRAVKLQGEVDSARRIIWLLVQRLGGAVTLTGEELDNLPPHPALTFFDRHGLDGSRIIAGTYIVPEAGQGG